MWGVGRIVERKPFSDKNYTQVWIYVPTEVAQSKTFPFKKGEKVFILIDEKKHQLTIKKAEVQTG
jgi:hypothetical protein